MMEGNDKIQGAVPGSLMPLDLDTLAQTGKMIAENPGGRILDAGDRVAVVEFRTKANVITDDVCNLILKATDGSLKGIDAIVIGNRGKHFCAGANLSYVLETALLGEWKKIEETIQLLQRATMSLKYGPLPTVAAPFSSALGGGCEICLHSDRVVAAEDTHMGLVETGVGLIPAGGGTKELAVRALKLLSPLTPIAPDSLLTSVFNTISKARVSRDGAQAVLFYLSRNAVVLPSQDSLIPVAKYMALGLLEQGYQKPVPQLNIPLLGSGGISIFESMIAEQLEKELISAHDALIARHLANIVCGGDLPPGIANEEHFLELEREGFLSLLGTDKTQERISYLLKNNTILRN
jgi:3-hydroxyacyl-CoA dehydrogenase